MQIVDIICGTKIKRVFIPLANMTAYATLLSNLIKAVDNLNAERISIKTILMIGIFSEHPS